MKQLWPREASKKKVHVIEKQGTMYDPDALTITIDDEPVQADSWRRYRDGGTTIIETPRGRIYMPSPFKKDIMPTLDGKEIDLLWEAMD